MYFKDLQTILQKLTNAKVTHAQIAQCLGVTTGAISQRINNPSSMLRFDELKKLESYFNVNFQNTIHACRSNCPVQTAQQLKLTTGDRLQTVRKYLNLHAEDVAKDLNMKLRTLGAYERNENYPPDEFFQKFFDRYGVSPDFIYKGLPPMFQKDRLNKDIPVLPDSIKEADIIELECIERIHSECGSRHELYGELNVEPFKISRQSIMTYLRCSSPENLKTFQATGDSMEITISHGDWLLVDVGFKDASVSGVYIFTANGKYRCKRLNLNLNGTLEVKSDNPLYKDEFINSNDNIEINIIGRVLINLSRGL